ncbi:ABC transporter permease [Streptomyces sp. G-G2]|uniref:ABC transporter permease n=1 Tax=Streptomyces sp. G-G2 TaxID=3046201 RepID=UPI0024B909D8|nr:ABC transporter permease [Streptomyces sp. G-G2]MDJ0380745.1 ABC transporter permease [Streptomyces sp. G-G2]
MRTWYHSWIAALRIARRDAWRAKGRSALVLAMLALPILGVSAADLTLRSAQLTPQQKLDRRMGAADAELRGTGLGVPVYQQPDAENYAPVGGFASYTPPQSGRPDTDATPALPANAESVKDSRGYGKMRTTHGLLDMQMRELDTASPLVKGLITLTGGQLPKRPGEVIATHAFLSEAGYSVGSDVTPRGMKTPLKIVGSYEMPDQLKVPEIIAPPGTLIAPLDRALTEAGLNGIRPTDTYLVKVGGAGFTWNMVKEANAKGVAVYSRAVALHPPADSEVPYFQQEKNRFEPNRFGSATEMAIVATVVGLALLEVCLLAGPAFAVGARRSRRQLGLVGANGGDRRHIRAIVLSGGLVLGATAAVIGTALGVALTAALRPVLEEQLGVRFGGFNLKPLELAGIALLAVLTGLLAAIVPAVTASRQSVLASLTGRRGVRRSNRILPLLGLLALAGGAAIALYGTVSGMSSVVVAGGSAIAELGVVAMTPMLVGLFGRTGRWLPLSPRLALRDAVRNRGRTAPAVAAVLAAVAGTVAVATYQHSKDVQAQHEYVANLPGGSGSIRINEAGAYRDVPAARDALARRYPLGVRADVDRLVVGDPGCVTSAGQKECGRAEVIVPKEQRCPLEEAKNGPASFSLEERKKLRVDWRCVRGQYFARYDAVVADEKLLTALAVTDPGTVSALKGGRAVSFAKRNVKDDKVTIRLITDPEKANEAQSAHKELPGEDRVFRVHQAPESAESYGIELILPPAAVRTAGIATAPSGSYFTLDGKVTSTQVQQLSGDLDRMGLDASVFVEKGYQAPSDLALLALTLFAGLVTIGAAGIATGLAQADSEADLKTLAAVGAPPRVRRTLSGFQCGVVALMGVVLGSLTGILPAAGLRLLERHDLTRLYEYAIANGNEAAGADKPWVPIVVPWETLAGLLILVPLGAALLAALVTRSSGALGRRATD